MALAPGTWPRPLLRLIRAANKYLVNPLVKSRAGGKDSYAGAIRHTGRKSGKAYTTPVGVDRTPDGFVIPLGYGTRVDWLQNVLAGGRATVLAEGETHDVTAPEVIDAATALPLLPPKRQRSYRRIGIEHYLRVRLAEPRRGADLAEGRG